jgi:predicted RNA binding protein YcfA (HicA-like mRNA interferase family)
MNSRDVIRILKANGWYEVNHVGSHVQFEHAQIARPRHGSPSKKGHPNRDTEERRKTVRAEIQLEGKRHWTTSPICIRTRILISA